MPKHSSTPKRREDVNEAAFRIVQEATRERDSERARPLARAAVASPEQDATEKRKNPAAVALGKLGGKKGGPARARALSPERRKEIAREAARARWSKREEED